MLISHVTCYHYHIIPYLVHYLCTPHTQNKFDSHDYPTKHESVYHYVPNPTTQIWPSLIFHTGPNNVLYENQIYNSLPHSSHERSYRCQFNSEIYFYIEYQANHDNIYIT